MIAVGLYFWLVVGAALLALGVVAAIVVAVRRANRRMRP